MGSETTGGAAMPPEATVSEATPGEATRHGFCHGADMDPSRIRRRWPGARFVARARLVAGDGGTGQPGPGVTGQSGPDGHGPAPVPDGGPDLARPWGVLLTVPDHAVGGDPLPVMTDDGRTVAASVLTTPADLADPVETIRWARYWELDPAYVGALAAANGQPGPADEG